MNEILQIVSYAYIKMKCSRLQGSYHLVFGQITDNNAKQKTEMTIHEIFKKLNDDAEKLALKECPEMLESENFLFPLLKHFAFAFK